MPTPHPPIFPLLHFRFSSTSISGGLAVVLRRRGSQNLAPSSIHSLLLPNRTLSSSLPLSFIHFRSSSPSSMFPASSGVDGEEVSFFPSLVLSLGSSNPSMFWHCFLVVLVFLHCLSFSCESRWATWRIWPPSRLSSLGSTFSEFSSLISNLFSVFGVNCERIWNWVWVFHDLKTD